MSRLSHDSQWYVSLRGGLGNRVMMLASLLRLHHRSLTAMPTVNWTINEHCLARFDDLFQPLPDLRLVHGDPEIDTAATPGPQVGSRPPHDPEWEQLGLLEESRVLRDEDVQIAFWGWLFHPSDVRRDPRAIRRELARAARSFRPLPGLLEGIVRADCLGVHARRTDRSDSLTPGADGRLAEAIRRSGAERIVLATDAPGIIERLRDLRIEVLCNAPLGLPEEVWPEWSPGDPRRVRREVSVMQAALRDLYSLSHCRSIVRDVRSTFSQVAAVMGDVNCRTIGGGRRER